MKNKKDTIISIGFVTIICTIFIINLIKPDEKISISERRKLEQFPNITSKEIFNGNISKKFENYAMDQYIARDLFRSIKTLFNFKIYKQKDNNRLFIKDDGIYKIEYPINENAIRKTAKKIKEIKDKYKSIISNKYMLILKNFKKEIEKIYDIFNDLNSEYLNIEKNNWFELTKRLEERKVYRILLKRGEKTYNIIKNLTEKGEYSDLIVKELCKLNEFLKYISKKNLLKTLIDKENNEINKNYKGYLENLNKRC